MSRYSYVSIRRNKKVTQILRNLPVGESVVLKGTTESARQMASRLSREGFRFRTSVKGITNGIKIERVG